VTAGWTTNDMPDLSGTVAIVTGANSGIGFAAARELAHKRATVVLACRSRNRGRAAIEAIRAEIPEARLEVMELDLASLSSIRAFADAFRARYERLDLLIHNAGVMLCPSAVTQDGFERHFGINHLGHFALTGLLLDRLLATRSSRVVTVSSLAHARGRLDVADLMGQHGTRHAPGAAYARSKLANLLFARELNRRFGHNGIVSVAAHPGGVATGLGRRMTDRAFYRRILPVLEWLSQSAAQGARSILCAATDPKAVGGQTYGPSGLFGMRGHPAVVRSSRRSHDEDLARRLWDVSEELTGVRYAADIGQTLCEGCLTPPGIPT
jgi:NAD(P)-dependent dehydrogenase (short-subunit alcohol dehydrogenase family)